MKKFICKNCKSIWHSAADVTICPECKGELKEANNKYYFTFGSSGQIYDGGWVEIYADSLGEAQQKFIKRYGERAYKAPGILNYSWDYTEEEFKKTIMYTGDNFGVRCHEVIK